MYSIFVANNLLVMFSVFLKTSLLFT